MSRSWTRNIWRWYIRLKLWSWTYMYVWTKSRPSFQTRIRWQF
ncbi:hypothetical protein ID866_9751 [Astraeus odoratus]|nr:hypothetical protein ID866_9751 [Astraeus odoratus]